MALEPRSRARLATAGILFLLLSSGVVLGVALDRQIGAGTVDGANRGGWGRNSDSGENARDSTSRNRDPRRRSLLVEQVGLSEMQKAQVDSIVAFYRGEMRDLHEEFDKAYTSRYREITEATREDIRGILNVEQGFAYDSLLVEWDSRVRQRREDSISGSGTARGRGGGGD